MVAFEVGGVDFLTDGGFADQRRGACLLRLDELGERLVRTDDDHALRISGLQAPHIVF